MYKQKTISLSSLSYLYKRQRRRLTILVPPLHYRVPFFAFRFLHSTVFLATRGFFFFVSSNSLFNDFYSLLGQLASLFNNPFVPPRGLSHFLTVQFQFLLSIQTFFPLTIQVSFLTVQSPCSHCKLVAHQCTKHRSHGLIIKSIIPMS
jgi:hypothetical protein